MCQFQHYFPTRDWQDKLLRSSSSNFCLAPQTLYKSPLFSVNGTPVGVGISPLTYFRILSRVSSYSCILIIPSWLVGKSSSLTDTSCSFFHCNFFFCLWLLDFLDFPGLSKMSSSRPSIALTYFSSSDSKDFVELLFSILSLVVSPPFAAEICSDFV